MIYWKGIPSKQQITNIGFQYLQKLNKMVHLDVYHNFRGGNNPQEDGNIKKIDMDTNISISLEVTNLY